MDCDLLNVSDNLHLELSSDEEEEFLFQTRQRYDSGYSAEEDTSIEYPSFADQDQDQGANQDQAQDQDRGDDQDQAQDQVQDDYQDRSRDEDSDDDISESDDLPSIRVLAAEMRSLRRQVASQQRLIEELHKVIIAKSRTVQRADVFEEMPGDSSTLKIGNGEHITVVSREKFRLALSRAKCGQSLLLKTMGLVYGKEELAGFSYHGDKTADPPLSALVEDGRFKAITIQVEKTFPRFDSPRKIRLVREAVNGKCRKQRRLFRMNATA